MAMFAAGTVLQAGAITSGWAVMEFPQAPGLSVEWVAPEAWNVNRGVGLERASAGASYDPATRLLTLQTSLGDESSAQFHGSIMGHSPTIRVLNTTHSAREASVRYGFIIWATATGVPEGTNSARYSMMAAGMPELYGEAFAFTSPGFGRGYPSQEMVCSSLMYPATCDFVTSTRTLDAGEWFDYRIQVSTSVWQQAPGQVPEPGTLALMAGGLTAAVCFRKYRR
jgi:hypothetical protein